MPKTVLQVFQLDSLAGTTESEGSVAVMPTILQVERAYWTTSLPFMNGWIVRR